MLPQNKQKSHALDAVQQTDKLRASYPRIVDIPQDPLIATDLERVVVGRNAAAEHMTREHILHLFVEHTPAAIAMFDREMRYITASRRYLLDYRITEAEISGRSHFEIFPEISERWKAIHRRCLAGAIESAEEDPFPRADGTLDWVRWEIHPWKTLRSDRPYRGGWSVEKTRAYILEQSARHFDPRIVEVFLQIIDEG